MQLPPEQQRALEQLVVPTGGDLIEARATILDALSDGASWHEAELTASVLSSRSLPDAGTEELTFNQDANGQLPTPRGDEAPIVRVRLTTAARTVLAGLAREGIIIAVAGDRYSVNKSQLTVKVVQAGGSSSSRGPVQFSNPVPVLAASPEHCRWQLAEHVTSPRQQLARVAMADGLEHLLGERGLEVLREAIACFWSGRFLAAVNLLAASSEAAWFGLGSAAAAHNDALATRIAKREQILEIINRTTEVMKSRNVLSSGTLSDLRAQAARFRDLRNYGLHPVGDPDADREEAFTEAGSAALFMTARRYFTQLEQARQALLD